MERSSLDWRIWAPALSEHIDADHVRITREWSVEDLVEAHEAMAVMAEVTQPPPGKRGTR